MVKYISTNSTAKSGVNYVKSIVRQAGCNFFQIQLENDLGIDVIIELIDNKKSRRIAIQVKSGNSHYDPSKVSCRIPVTSHYEYWSEFEIPVIGIAYIPLLHKAFWIDIKSYFHKNGKTSQVIFECTNENELHLHSFINEILNKCKHVSDVNELIDTFFKDTTNDFYLTFLNILNPIFKSVKSKILISGSISELIESLGWRIISNEEYEKSKQSSSFSVATNGINGSFYWSHEIHFVQLDSFFTDYINEKFVKLKEIINGNSGLIL